MKADQRKLRRFKTQAAKIRRGAIELLKQQKRTLIVWPPLAFLCTPSHFYVFLNACDISLIPPHTLFHACMLPFNDMHAA